MHVCICEETNFEDLYKLEKIKQIALYSIWRYNTVY